jgi:hypothetical protein
MQARDRARQEARELGALRAEPRVQRRPLAFQAALDLAATAAAEISIMREIDAPIAPATPA